TTAAAPGWPFPAAPPSAGSPPATERAAARRGRRARSRGRPPRRRCWWCRGRCRPNNAGPSGQLLLGRSNDGGVAGRRWHPHLRSLPAVVAEDARKRRTSGDVTRETNGVGIETGGERDAAALRLRAHRSERKSLAHGLAAPVVHGAGGSSHLCVGKARQLLLAEVDQAPLSLQERQQVARRTGGLRTRRCGQWRAGWVHGGGPPCGPGLVD